jgi:tight adherence protein B
MLLAFAVFVVVTGGVIAGYLSLEHLPGAAARRRLERRLRDVGPEVVEEDKQATVVRKTAEGPLPGLDRLMARSRAGSGLVKLIEQSGVHTTPGAFVLTSLISAAVVGFLVGTTVRLPFMPAFGAAVGAVLPAMWLLHRRRSRLRRFEEQFPEALDLLARALRAGHALQAALGMVADELPAPVGVEFKKVFDQQNFGLPLRDALDELAQRIPLMDMRFFVTAIAIQRDTGGNLAEILDNLANVVRERFKILRQVRVHTAHGRFTGYVLLALPAVLAIALSFINPGHMNLLFQEHVGQVMLAATIVMQSVGYFWIRQVIKIEV